MTNDKKQELALILGEIASAEGRHNDATNYFKYAGGGVSYYYDNDDDQWLSLMEQQNIDYGIDKAKDKLEIALEEKEKRDRDEQIRSEAEKKIYLMEKERYYKDKACFALENCDILYRRLMDKILSPDCDIIVDLLMLMTKTMEKEPDKIMCLSYDLLKMVVEEMPKEYNRDGIIIALLRLAHERHIGIVDLVKLVVEKEIPHGKFNEMLEELTPKKKSESWF